MPLIQIGFLPTRPLPDGWMASSGTIDPAFVRPYARAHDEAGYDYVLIGWSATGPDGFTTAAFASCVTERLRFMIAHRTGFVAPTVLARKLATLDHYSAGRAAIHIITGGNDLDQQRDGDWVDHDTRYARTDEFLHLMRREWLAPEPFDFEGKFYRVTRAFSDVKPVQQPHPTIFFGGNSPPAVATGAKHADIYMLGSEPLAIIAERAAAIRQAAAPHGRTPRLGISTRAILGKTEDEAWERAFAIRDRAARFSHLQTVRQEWGQTDGARRALEMAQQQPRYDKRLWTGLAPAVAGAGPVAVFVGTPEQVAEALLDYYDLGVSAFLVRGFDLDREIEEVGREMFPILRAEIERRDRAAAKRNGNEGAG
ncbi:MAG: hypothetical protein KatS3mg060_2395 [Dehalococcoidia bacterium]|nr:MAG: hypothetical protein KatS3mg060_2395 [Dehalococcoidia bacterium]